MNIDVVSTVSNKVIMQDIGGRKLKYMEDDVVSGVLETKKYRITSQQTLQTEGDQLVNQYTAQSV